MRVGSGNVSSLQIHEYLSNNLTLETSGVKTPKDMPWSDYMMHDNVRYLLRDPPSLNPTSEKSVTSYVRHRVDTLLIMGDEDKCKQWSTLCLGYVRKQPHGYEIDLARSFLRVNANFLRGLQECWWE